MKEIKSGKNMAILTLIAGVMFRKNEKRRVRTWEEKKRRVR